MKYVFLAIAGAALLALGYLAWKPGEAISVAAPPPVSAPPAPPLTDGGSDWLTPPATAEPEEAYADVELDEDAIASLRGGRLFGDPRSPPIAAGTPQEQATAEQLADPEKYAEFEGRQERKLKRAYVIEAEKYVTQLRADILKGKSMGIPPDEIAKVERKVRGIEAMRAQLLQEDPGLLDTDSPLPKRAPVALPTTPPRLPGSDN